MTLSGLLKDLATTPVPSRSVAGVACHSQQVRPGDLFVAVRGPHHDGHQFLDEAIQRGACAVVVEQRPDRPLPCPVIAVEDTQRSLSIIAARFYRHPVERLRLIGVTGTCGKTTTVYLTKAILEAAGHRVGLLGTVAYEIGERYLPSTNTTPGALALQQMFAQMAERGLGWCAMEVSSHALAQRRIDGLTFEAAVWTCLGSDHLDYHKTLEHYAQSKRRIFSYLRPDGHAVINVDDAYGQTLVETLSGVPLVAYTVQSEGASRSAQGLGTEAVGARLSLVAVRVLASSWGGMSLVVDSPWGTFPVTTPMVGRHNVSNIAAACSACLSVGISPSAIRQALDEFPQVPGRLERVPNETGIHVVVDFAHTADALHRVLLSLRELVRGRLIVVFGCGGDRDQLKRPAMGKVASLLADAVVLTADNPRSEDPSDIIRQIQSGCVPGFRESISIVDREEAIVTALSMARPDDAVLIAGKGHEAYQIFQHITRPFSDREVVERYFRSAKTIAV